MRLSQLTNGLLLDRYLSYFNKLLLDYTYETGDQRSRSKHIVISDNFMSRLDVSATADHTLLYRNEPIEMVTQSGYSDLQPVMLTRTLGSRPRTQDVNVKFFTRLFTLF